MRLLCLLFVALEVHAEPLIFRLAYGPPLPIVDGVEYAPESPQVYCEFSDLTNFTAGISLNTRATVAVSWSTSTGHVYAVQSTPVLSDWRTPFVRNSPWIPATNGSLTWTQSFCEGQRFFRIVER